MDTLAEGNKSTPCSYVSLMTTAVLFLFFILICKLYVIGNSDSTIPLILKHLLTTTAVTIMTDAAVSIHI